MNRSTPFTAGRGPTALAGVIALALAVGACGDDDGGGPSTGAPTSATTTIAASGFRYGTGACAPTDRADIDEPVRAFDDSPQQCLDPHVGYVATFETSEGDIVAELDAANVPGTVNNFVNLARFGYYDDTPIFRADPTIDLFQAGGQNNTASPGYTIDDEGSGYTYTVGVLAMANTGAPDSGSAQWFFVTGPKASYLDSYGTYVVFGRIADGLDVAQEITALGQAGGRPTRDLTLDTVTITETPAA